MLRGAPQSERAYRGSTVILRKSAHAKLRGAIQSERDAPPRSCAAAASLPLGPLAKRPWAAQALKSSLIVNL